MINCEFGHTPGCMSVDYCVDSLTRVWCVASGVPEKRERMCLLFVLPEIVTVLSGSLLLQFHFA